MSYNQQPTWTDDVEMVDPERKQFCPTCGKMFANIGIVRESIFEHGYYSPRHVPPSLIFTCCNADCIDCDKDFEVKVSVRIHLDGVVDCDQNAIGLLRRAYTAMNKAEWEAGETEIEICEAINDFMSNRFGGDWNQQREVGR